MSSPLLFSLSFFPLLIILAGYRRKAEIDLRKQSSNVLLIHMTIWQCHQKECQAIWFLRTSGCWVQQLCCFWSRLKDLENKLTAARGDEWREGIVSEFGMDVYTLLYLKWITNMGLQYSTWNSAEWYVAASIRGESAGRMDTCMCYDLVPLLLTWNYHNIVC